VTEFRETKRATFGRKERKREWRRGQDPNVFGTIEGLPYDSNFLNVQGYGATGNGVTDDTAAIMAAIAALPSYSAAHNNTCQIIYFPRGTYLISSTITRGTSGAWLANLIFIGENQGNTIIRLKDSCSGFTSAGSPKPMISMNSGNYYGQSNPTTGAGNEAFNNTIENMTIHAGAGNAGAVAVAYVCNNYGVIRNVTFTSTNAAYMAIDMTRGSGPALISFVTISGAYQTGIDLRITEQSMTFEHLTISGTTVCGIKCPQNILSCRDINITCNGGYGVDPSEGTGTEVVPPWGYNGLVWTWIDGTIGGTGTAPVLLTTVGGNRNWKNVKAVNFNGSVNTDFSGVWRLGAQIGTPNWAITPKNTPTPAYHGTGTWLKIVAPQQPTDATSAIQTALNSSTTAAVAYLPTGDYSITGNITIPDNYERIEIMYSRFWTTSYVPIFKVNNTRTKDLFLRRMLSTQAGSASESLIQWNVSSRLIVTDGSVFNIDHMPGGGEVYIENINCGHLTLYGSTSTVFCRQLDPESGSTKVFNYNENLWVLGFKTETSVTSLQQIGGNTELIGNFALPNNLATVPMFSIAVSGADNLLDSPSKAFNLTLSNGNLTITATANVPAGLCARTVNGVSSGKWYFEGKINVAGGNLGVGVVDNVQSLANGNALGQSGSHSAGLQSSTGALNYNGTNQITAFAPWSTVGAVGCVALDATNKLVWMRVNGGNWNNSGSANPATGTGGISIAGLSYPIYFALEADVNNAQITANFGADLNQYVLAFAYSAPAGFEKDGRFATAIGTEEFGAGSGLGWPTWLTSMANSLVNNVPRTSSNLYPRGVYSAAATPLLTTDNFIPHIVWANTTIVSSTTVGTTVGTATLSSDYVYTGTPVWTLSGGGGLFAINSSTGVVTVASSLSTGLKSFTISVSGSLIFGATAAGSIPSITAQVNVTTTTGTQLDIFKTAAELTLSTSALVVTTNASPGTGGGAISLSTTSHSSGKYFFKVTITTLAGGSGTMGIGFADSVQQVGGGHYLGESNGSHSVGYFASGGVYLNAGVLLSGSLWSGTTTGYIAVDLTAQKLWTSANGSTWNNDILANQNPATGVGGLNLSAMPSGVAYFAGVEADYIGNVLTVDFSGTGAPTGFSPW
jgi:hypothetical protein